MDDDYDIDALLEAPLKESKNNEDRHRRRSKSPPNNGKEKDNKEKDRDDRDSRNNRRGRDSDNSSSSSHYGGNDDNRDSSRRNRREDRKEKEPEMSEEEKQRLEEERDARTVFVSNLPLKASERDIKEFFGQVGKVIAVSLVTDKFSKKSKGFGYIEFAQKDNVQSALTLNNTKFMKNTINVILTESEKNKLSDKKKLQLKLQQEKLKIQQQILDLEYEEQKKINPNAKKPPNLLANPHLATTLEFNRMPIPGRLPMPPGFPGMMPGMMPPPGMMPGMMPGMIPGRGLPIPGMMPGMISPFPGSVTPMNQIEMKRIWVGSLDFSVTEEVLRETLKKFGEIENVKLHIDPETGKSKGFAFVQFKNFEDAKKAINSAAGILINGRPIKVGSESGMKKETPFLVELDDDDNGGNISNQQSRLSIMAKLDRTGGITQPISLQPTTSVPISSPCILLTNMFDPEEETEEGWDKEIEDEVKSECEKFGPVQHIKLIKNSKGNVYVKFATVVGAQLALNALNRRYFSGKMVTAQFIPLFEYHQKFGV